MGEDIFHSTAFFPETHIANLALLYVPSKKLLDLNTFLDSRSPLAASWTRMYDTSVKILEILVSLYGSSKYMTSMFNFYKSPIRPKIE